jgi:hypothetical protein
MRVTHLCCFPVQLSITFHHVNLAVLNDILAIENTIVTAADESPKLLRRLLLREVQRREKRPERRVTRGNWHVIAFGRHEATSGKVTLACNSVIRASFSLPLREPRIEVPNDCIVMRLTQQ